MFKFVKFIFIFLLLVPLSAFEAEARKTVATYNHLTAYVDDDYKCQDKVQLYIKSPHRSFFQSEIRHVNTVGYKARQNLMKDCPGLKKIEVSGLVRDNEVYTGYMSLDTQWFLKKNISKSQKSINIPRTRTPGEPYINKYNELVIYDSGPFTISSPLNNKGRRLRVHYFVDTVKEWCERINQPFLFEFDGDWKYRNSLFKPNFEKFFLDKIFPEIKSLCVKTNANIDRQTYTFSMRKRNEHSTWDLISVSVEFKQGSYEIKTLKKSYSLIDGRQFITGKEREKLFKEMNRRWLVNVPGTEIYKDEFINIYSHHSGDRVDYNIGRAGWCDKAKLNVVYKMPLEERDKKITYKYLSPIIYNILNQHCDVPTSAYLYFYPENSDSHWDETMYQYCRLAGMNDICSPENTKLEYGFESGRSDGPLKINALIEKYRKNPYYLWETDEGVFGSLPGGIYLNAIYNNDIETIRKMDNLAHRELVAKVYGLQTKAGLYMIGVDLTKYVKPKSLILEVANQYMYHYQYNNSGCLRTDFYERTYTHTADTIRYENLYGMDMGSVGGWTASTTYQVNREFKPLLDYLGEFALFADIEITASLLKLRGLTRVGQDVKALQKNFKCNGPVIKRFESNLISLASQYIRNGNSYGGKKVKKQSERVIKNKSAPKTGSQNSSKPIRSIPKFEGSWKGIIEDQPVEIVLWPSPSNSNYFVGLAYAPGYDCLMYADVRKGTSLFQLSFGINRVITRKNNCMLNADELSGRYKNTFQAGGYVSVDKNSGILEFRATNFYLGRKIVDGEKTINFKRSPVSSKMLESINGSDKINRIIGKPDAKLLSEMKK